MASYGFFESKLRLILAKIFGLRKEFFSNTELSYNSCQHFGKTRLWGYSEEKPYGSQEWEQLEERFKPPNLPTHLNTKSKKFIDDNFHCVGDKKWVTLHVLDNTLTEYARGADINSYNRAIEHLIGEGYIVFRIGDNSMPRCKEVEGLIDLAHFKHENFLDLFLINNAEFHIGLGSGPNYLTHLFKKDLLVTNLTEWSTSLPRKRGNFFILKKFFRASSGKQFSIRDLLNESFNFQINTNFYEDRDLVIHDNTDEEILIALKEFLAFDSRNSLYNDQQMLFDKIKNEWLKKELSTEGVEIYYSSKKEFDLQRVRSRALSTLKGTIAPTFLEANWK